MPPFISLLSKEDKYFPFREGWQLFVSLQTVHFLNSSSSLSGPAELTKNSQPLGVC